VRIITIRGA